MRDSRQKSSYFFSKLLSKIFSIWPLLAIFFIVSVFFYPVLLQEKIPLPTDALVGAHIPWTETVWEGYPAGVPIKNLEITDAISQFYPWKSLAAEFWRAGKIPLWNYYMFNGAPFLATLHSSVIYPLNFVYLLFRDSTAWSILIFLQILLSSYFMYLLLRSFNLRKDSSFLGSIAFAFSGYMIAWLEFTTGGHAGLWLPILLYFERKFILSNKLHFFLVLPFIFFMIFTAGDFQVPFYIVVSYFLFGLFEIYGKTTVKYKLKTLFYIILAFLFGILFSLPQLLPTIELFKVSVRVDDPYIKQYFYGLMNWEKITNFIWPDFFGNIVTRNYWGKYGFHEYISYVGIIPLIFTFFSLFTRKIKLEKFFWLLLVLSLLFLFPTPLAYLPYKLKIPGLGTSFASRIIFLTDFCLALIASFGYDKWMKSKASIILKILVYFIAIILGISIGVILSISIMNEASNLSFPMLINLKVTLKNMIPQNLLVILIFFVLATYYHFSKRINGKIISQKFFVLISVFIMTLAILDLLRFAWKNTPFGPIRFLYPTTKTIDFLKDRPGIFRIAGGIPTNLFMPYKLVSAEGYDPLFPKRNSEWYSIVDWEHPNFLTGRYGLIHYFNSPLINYANVRYVMDYKKDVYRQINDDGHLYDGIQEPRYRQVYYDSRIYIFENMESLPYVWATKNYEVVKDPKLYVDTLNTKSEPAILLEEYPEININKNKFFYEITNLHKDYNEISFNISTSDNSLAFLSESYFPGWKAYIDTKEVNILRANYIFQSIAIPKGNHKVAFKYEPKSFKIGVLFSFIALITLFFCVYKYAKK